MPVTSHTTGRLGKSWRMDLICCAHNDGSVWADTRDELDEFRRAYVEAPGHSRQGIITRERNPVSNA